MTDLGGLMRQHHIAIRAATAVAAGALGLLGLEYALLRAVVAQWSAVSAQGSTTPDEALTLLAAAVAVLLMAWLGLSTLAALLAHLPGRIGGLAEALAAACAPALSRRVAAVMVGATVTGALSPGTAVGGAGHPQAVPAAQVRAAQTQDRIGSARAAARAPGFHVSDDFLGRLPGPGWAPPAPAAPGFSPTPASSGTPGADDGAMAAVVTSAPRSGAPSPGWTPSRPPVRPQPSPRLLGGSPAIQDRAAHVVVHRGDTLWDIVRQHLGSGATDAEVAAAWPAWHEANREVIGPDPNLILPGQVLHAPASRHLSQRGHR